MKNIYVCIFATIAFSISSVEACHYANAKSKRKFDIITMPCDLALLQPSHNDDLEMSDEHKSPLQHPQNPTLEIPSLTLGENVISASERKNYRDNDSDSPLHKKARPSRSLFERKETTASHESNNFPILNILQKKEASDQKAQEVLKKCIESELVINLIMQYLNEENA